MKIDGNNKSVLRKSLLFVLVMAVPAFARSQAGNDKKAPNAPVSQPSVAAPKPSAPAARTATPKSAAPPTTPSAQPSQQGPGTAGNSGAHTARPGATPVRTSLTTKLAVTPPSSTVKPQVIKQSSKPPLRDVQLRDGTKAQIRPNGQIRSVTRNGMQISHNLNGGRTIVSTTPGGARIVTTGRNSGYVQRPYFSRGGLTYVQRTVVVNNVTYNTVYRS